MIGCLSGRPIHDAAKLLANYSPIATAARKLAAGKRKLMVPSSVTACDDSNVTNINVVVLILTRS
jgi:hypothetical protein